jgi:hypothetical protein
VPVRSLRFVPREQIGYWIGWILGFAILGWIAAQVARYAPVLLLFLPPLDLLVTERASEIIVDFLMWPSALLKLGDHYLGIDPYEILGEDLYGCRFPGPAAVRLNCAAYALMGFVFAWLRRWLRRLKTEGAGATPPGCPDAH